MGARRRATVWAAIAAVLTAVLAGCSGVIDGRSTPPRVFHPPTGADEVVVRVMSSGGYVPQSAYLSVVAAYTLLGDGTLIAASRDSYDDALPDLESVTLTSGQIADLLERADDAGILGPEQDYDQPGVTDMSTTYVTVNVDGKEYAQSAYALYFTDNDDDLAPAARKKRAQLRSFIGRLGDLADDAEDYVPNEVVVERLPAPGDPGSKTVRPWPIGTAPAASGDCVVVDGDEVTTLLDAAKDASLGDLWQVGAEPPAPFVMRPKLPGGQGCGK